MRSLPIRVRLTLPYAIAMALVLVGLGAFLYIRVGATLLATVDQGLRAQTSEALSHLGSDRPLLDRDALDNAGIAEILSAKGRVLRSQPSGFEPLIDEHTRSLALTGRTVYVTTSISGLHGDWRLLVTPADRAHPAKLLVLGRSLENRGETLDHLVHEFWFSAPAALLLAILAGYGLAAAALRPVEAMRRRAAVITASTPGSRLPVPPGSDEISRLAQTLNGMLDRLEEAFQHERRFVSDASHELRTPLALLRTELELALRRTRTREELEQALRSAAEETERLTRLAEDLLLLARSEQTALLVRHRDLDVRDLLTDVVDRFALRADELGRSLEVEPGGVVLLEADPDRVEQAVGNLVENALTHGAGAVRVSAHLRGDRVELHVTDEGPGLPVGFVPRAFHRFSRADAARSRGGSGLGLAIVHAIAEAHGGSAGIANRPGGGADCWISLPGARGWVGPADGTTPAPVLSDVS